MALESGEKHTLEQAIAGALQAGLGTEEGSMLADAQEELVIMEAEEAEERALKQAARAQEQEKIKLASLQVRTNTSTAREFAQSGSTSTATTQFVEIELYLLALRIVEYSEGRGADCRDAGRRPCAQKLLRPCRYVMFAGGAGEHGRPGGGGGAGAAQGAASGAARGGSPRLGRDGEAHARARAWPHGTHTDCSSAKTG